MKEVWKDVKRFEGLYQVSNLGRIKSLNRVETMCNGKVRFRHERVLTPVGKYGVISLWKHSQSYTTTIHHLMKENEVM